MVTKQEILSQTEIFKNIKEEYRRIIKPLKGALEKNDFKEIGFVGCGSSYYLAMGLAYNVNRLSDGKIKAKAYTGSELAFGLTKIRENSLMIGLSRSGESTETVNALEKVKRDQGATTACITCSPHSSMVEKSDYSASIDFVNEQSIVMTQSFTSMAFLGTILLHEIFKNDQLEYIETTINSSESIIEKMQKKIEQINLKRMDHFVFLGYDEYFASSMEGLVKITEMSLSEVDVFPTLEYRHGPKAKVHKGTLTFMLPNHIIFNEEMKMADEIAKLGGEIIIISPEKEKDFSSIKYPYKKNDFSDWFLRVIPLQWLGYNMAITKGLDPDKPKNLDKVVQLEE